MMDSLAGMPLSDERKLMGNEIYFLARQVFNEQPFIHSDDAIQQLKKRRESTSDRQKKHGQ